MPAGRPSTVTVPDSTIWVPTTERSSVVFPQPDGPSSPVIEPRDTRKLRSCNTVSFLRRTVSPATVTAAEPADE